MGSGYFVTCDSCDFVNLFHLGVGMAYSSLENVIGLVHYTRHKKIKNILKIHTLTPDSWENPNPFYTHRMYRCAKCSKLRTCFYVKICYDNDLVYETDFKCYRCKSILEEVDPADITNHPCPECGKTTMSSHEDILWD